MITHFTFLPVIIVAITTIVALFLLKSFSTQMGLLDFPGGRKEHETATPLVGGIAIYLGLITGSLFLPYIPYTMLAASLLVVMLGVWDDRYDISPLIRLFIQLLALCMMVFAGKVALKHFGPLFGKGALHLGVWSVPLTLFGAATLINAMNMIDGLDGLAGSLALLTSLSLTGIAWASGLPSQSLILAMISTALLVFLCFNFPLWPGRKASVFLGDAGSTLIGFILAWFTIDLSQQSATIAPPAVMLWVVAVPIMDLAVVFLKRLKQGRSPFKPGKEHIQDVLMRQGLSRFQSLWVILGMGATGQIVAWGMMLRQVPDSVVLGSFLITFGVYATWNRLISFKSVD